MINSSIIISPFHVLILMIFLQFGDDPYLVLVDPGENGEFKEAAETLASLHNAKLEAFDESTMVSLFKKYKPSFVAFVLPPERIDEDLCHRILKAAAELDDDPFIDFEYGFITGGNGKKALDFVNRIKEAWRHKFKNKVSMFGSFSGPCNTKDDPVSAFKAMGLNATINYVNIKLDEKERIESARKNVTSLKGMDALLFFSHGYPNEMCGCFSAKDLRDWNVSFEPAIVVNCSCYNGAPGRWFMLNPRGGIDKGIVSRDDSVALAILDTGVSGYIGGVSPWHGPLACQAFCHVIDDGMRLGEAIKRLLDRLAIEYLPGGIDLAPASEYKFKGEGEKNRRRNSAAVILFGDPALAPFKDKGDSRAYAEYESVENEKIQIRLGFKSMVSGQIAGQDMMIPNNRVLNYFSVKTGNFMKELKMEIYQTIPFSADKFEGAEFSIVSAKSGEYDVPTKQPVCLMEKTAKGGVLHMRIPLDIPAMGTIWTWKIAKDGIDVIVECKTSK